MPRTLKTIALSCAVGTLASGLALAAGWQQARGESDVDFAQSQTRRDLRSFDQDLRDYREKKHALPASLHDLYLFGQFRVRPDENGVFRDGWRRPYLYTRRGDGYLIVSYGRDGKPGGTGLDCDLSTDRPDPPQARITFRQLLSLPQGRSGLAAAVITGILACSLCVFVIRPEDLSRSGIGALLVKLFFTLLGAGFAGGVIAVFHFIPSGH